jgi:hypothetical protein
MIWRVHPLIKINTRISETPVHILNYNVSKPLVFRQPDNHMNLYHLEGD